LALPHETPVCLKSVHSDFSCQSDNLDEARHAVLQDLGSSIPEISFEDFLDYLAPPLPAFDIKKTMALLESGPNPTIISKSKRWSGFPKNPKDSGSVEIETFSPMLDIFSDIVAAIEKTAKKKADRTVDFLQLPHRAPVSLSERRNKTKPDGYLVLKNRNKGASDIFWVDIVLSCEYKLNDSKDDLSDVRIHRSL
jgi:hypothetical protein